MTLVNAILFSIVIFLPFSQRESFLASLDMLGDVIFLHHHSNLSERASDADVRAHRVCYLALSSFAVKYLDCLLPPQHVCTASLMLRSVSVLVLPRITTVVAGRRRADGRLQSSAHTSRARRESHAQLRRRPRVSAAVLAARQPHVT